MGERRFASQCIFGSAGPPLTEEHVFGDWLRNLGFTGEGVREFHPSDGGEPVIQRCGDFTKKLKIVCKSCNEVWMSILEQAAKPLLLRMFSLPYSPYQRPQLALDISDQLALAQWAFKTAVIALYVDRPAAFRAHTATSSTSTNSTTRRSNPRFGLAPPRCQTIPITENTSRRQISNQPAR